VGFPPRQPAAGTSRQLCLPAALGQGAPSGARFAGPADPAVGLGGWRGLWLVRFAVNDWRKAWEIGLGGL